MQIGFAPQVNSCHSSINVSSLLLSDRSVRSCSWPHRFRPQTDQTQAFKPKINLFELFDWWKRSVCVFFFLKGIRWRVGYHGGGAQAWMKAHEHRCAHTHTHSLRCRFNENSLCVCTYWLSGTMWISTLMKYWLEILKIHPTLIKSSLHCFIYTTITNLDEFLEQYWPLDSDICFHVWRFGNTVPRRVQSIRAGENTERIERLQPMRTQKR